MLNRLASPRLSTAGPTPIVQALSRRVAPRVPSNPPCHRAITTNARPVTFSGGIDPADNADSHIAEDLRKLSDKLKRSDIDSRESSKRVRVLIDTWSTVSHLAGIDGSYALKATLLVEFGRSLLERTLGLVHKLTASEVATVLYGIGKLRLRLAEEEPLGPHLAEKIETRLLHLLKGYQFRGSRTRYLVFAPALWLGLATSRYPWGPKLLNQLTAATLTAMDGWDVERVSNAAGYMALLRPMLSPEQKTELTRHVMRVLEGLGELQEETLFNLTGATFAARALSLPLGAETVAALAQAVPSMPMMIAGGILGMSNLTLILRDCVAMGYQPTAAEAESWYRLLLIAADYRLGDDDVEWADEADDPRYLSEICAYVDVEDFANMVMMLARCKEYRQVPPVVAERLVLEASYAPEDRCLAYALKRWRPFLPVASPPKQEPDTQPPHQPPVPPSKA